MIQLFNVSKSYDTCVVDAVSFSIKTHETLVILGRSGAGKSTLLKMINRLVPMSHGHIEIDGENILECDPIQLRRRIGYVFQRIGLFPHMTVLDNVAIPLTLIRTPKSERVARARDMLRFVKLDPDAYGLQFPRQLSGGQQQRVGVARALIHNPRYLLMDEPFGALDSVTRDALQDDFLTFKHALKKTVVFVTHDVMEGLRVGDRIAVMDAGRLVQIGTPNDILHHPKNDFVAALVQAKVARDKHYLDGLAESSP